VGQFWALLNIHLPGAEEVFVVSGTFCDGKNSYPAGTFIHNHAGSSHVPQLRIPVKLTSDTGYC